MRLWSFGFAFARVVADGADVMNIRFLLITLVAALAAVGCGKKDAEAGASNAAASGAPAAQEQPAAPRTIEITAGDNMKFNVQTIEAKAGEQLKVVLTNIGTQPKEVMGHNWVLLKKGADAAAFNAAAVTAKATDYIPAALTDQVVAHTALLGPRKSDEITFTVPSEPGEYPFLCSFPAHYQVGMKGVLVVK
jgi:Azurin